MKHKWFNFLQVVVMVIFLLGSSNLQMVFAQDEAPATADSGSVVVEESSSGDTGGEASAPETVTSDALAVEEATEAPTEAPTEAVTEAPAVEATVEATLGEPTMQPTEAPAVEEVVAEVVDALDSQNLTLADGNGEVLDMASQNTVDAITNGDPWFTIGVNKYQFLMSGDTCDPLAYYCDNSTNTPIQTALDYISTHSLTIDSNTLHVEQGTYNEEVTINDSSVFDGLTILGDPGDETVVGAAYNAPILDGTGKTTGFHIVNQSVSIIGFIIQNFTTGILVDVSSGNQDINIANNTIVDNTNGVVQSSTGTGSPNMTINYNIFTGNDVALSNALDNNNQYIFAQNNYWGCASGPVVERSGVYYQFDASGDRHTLSGEEVDSLDENCQYIAGNNVGNIYKHTRAGDWAPYKIVLFEYASSVPGCMDETALNYNQYATVSDDSCTYTCEWDETLTSDDPKCFEPCQYDANIPADDPECVPPSVYACTDPAATNYDDTPGVVTDNTLCEYPPVYACTDPAATNYDDTPGVVTDNTLCEYPPVLACTDPAALNYDATPGVVTDNTLRVYPTVIPPTIITVTGGPGLLIPVTGVGGLIPVTGGNQIVSGLGHSCMPYGDGVVCWGLNTSGQLGDGTTVNNNVAGYVKDLTGVSSLTAGSNHTCALTIDNEVWCWGENSYGQLGNGTTTNSSLPVQVTGFPANVLSLSAGEMFTCAQLANQEVWCWGKNNLGQLNDGSTSYQTKPVKAVLGASLSQISGGMNSLLVGDALGDILKWANQQSNPVQDASNTLAISANRWGGSGCSITMSGSIECWGDNLTAGVVDSKLPAIEIGTGADHSCVVNNDETVSCWGSNTYGELGNGSNLNSTIGVLVSNLTQAHTIGVGANHTCALVGASNLPVCWGENTYGQLGNGTNKDSNVPVRVILP